MAIPAYLFLKDDGGADIKGSVDVQDREGSIEILSFDHGLHIPTDSKPENSPAPGNMPPLTFKKSSTLPARIFTRLLPPGRHLKAQNLNGTELTTPGKKLNTSTCCLRT